MAGLIDEWVGCAYLFVQTTLEKDCLPTFYRNEWKKPHVYRALKRALSDAVGYSGLDAVGYSGPDAIGFDSGLDILKIHCSDPNLIIHLKFHKREKCRKFLQSYKEKRFQKVLLEFLGSSLSFSTQHPLKTELKAGAETLDSILWEEERCLESISRQKPDHLRDEEIANLEIIFKKLCLQENTAASLARQLMRRLSSESSLPTLNSSPPAGGPPEVSKSSAEEDTFSFQNQQFVNRKITADDHQLFSKLVSKKWKQVGRSLYLQTKCRALRDPFIDNLAIEYEREGLYEQAYQLLRRFIDSEGRKATIQCLVAALEDNGLISLAEELLGIHQSDV